jgi:hypothetical protein
MKVKGAKPVLLIFCAIFTIGALLITAIDHLNKKTRYIIEYGESPHQLLNYLKKWVPDPLTGIVGIFVFNEIPTNSQIEDIKKLTQKHGEGAKLFSFFHRRFQSAGRYTFPHTYSFTKRVYCQFRKETLDKNYFLLLAGGQLVSATQDLNLRDIHFSILKLRYPDKPISDYFANPARYKEHLITQFGNRALGVYDIEGDSLTTLGEIVETFPVIYFVNSKCSDCDLQAILPEINRKYASKNRECCVIFSAYSSNSVIRGLLRNGEIDVSTFIDMEDSMQVMDKIIDDRQRIVRLDRFEISQGLT